MNRVGISATRIVVVPGDAVREAIRRGIDPLPQSSHSTVTSRRGRPTLSDTPGRIVGEDCVHRSRTERSNGSPPTTSQLSRSAGRSHETAISRPDWVTLPSEPTKRQLTCCAQSGSSTRRTEPWTVTRIRPKTKPRVAIVECRTVMNARSIGPNAGCRMTQESIHPCFLPFLQEQINSLRKCSKRLRSLKCHVHPDAMSVYSGPN